MKKINPWRSYALSWLRSFPNNGKLSQKLPGYLGLALLSLVVYSCKKPNVQPDAVAVNPFTKDNLQTDWITGHAYVAAGNTANSTLEIYNPDAANWNTPSFSFKPTTALSYTAIEAGLFGGSTDVKVHYSTVFPNATSIMAVTDNSSICLAVWEGTWAMGRKLWGGYWQTHSPNFHSGELLPNGNMAVAATDPTYGNWVRVYNTSVASGANYAQFNLQEAHAVTWDPANNVLWTCGDTAYGATGHGILTALIIGGTRSAPTLTEDLTRRDTTPGRYPHEIAAYFGDTNKLLVSDVTGVFIYNKTTHTFTAVPGAANRTNVKGISNQPDNSYLVESRPNPCCATTDWVTNAVQFYNPTTGALAKTFTVSGAAFYKATCFTRAYQ